MTPVFDLNRPADGKRVEYKSWVPSNPPAQDVDKSSGKFTDLKRRIKYKIKIVRIKGLKLFGRFLGQRKISVTHHS